MFGFGGGLSSNITGAGIGWSEQAGIYVSALGLTYSSYGLSAGMSLGYGFSYQWPSAKRTSDVSLKEFDSQLSDDPVSPTDLNEFYQEHFGKKVSRMKHPPESVSIDDAIVEGNDPKSVATTIPTKGYYKPSSSRIYLHSKALSKGSRFLYFTLDHEIEHADHYSSGRYALWAILGGRANANNWSEVYAYRHSAVTASKLGLPHFRTWSIQQMNFFLP